MCWLNRISEERKNHRSQFSHTFPQNNLYLYHLLRLRGDVMQGGGGGGEAGRGRTVVDGGLEKRPKIQTLVMTTTSILSKDKMQAVSFLIARQLSKQSCSEYSIDIKKNRRKASNYWNTISPVRRAPYQLCQGVHPRVISYLRKFSERGVQHGRSLNKQQLH